MYREDPISRLRGDQVNNGILLDNSFVEQSTASEDAGSAGGGLSRRGVLWLPFIGAITPLTTACADWMPLYRDERDYPDDLPLPEEAASEAAASESAARGRASERERSAFQQNQDNYRALHRLVLKSDMNDKGENYVAAIARQLYASRQDTVGRGVAGGWLWSSPGQGLSIEYQNGGRAYDDGLTVTKTARYRGEESGTRRQLTATVGLIITKRSLANMGNPAEALRAIRANADGMIVESIQTTSTPLREDGDSDLTRTSEKDVTVYFRNGTDRGITTGDNGLPIATSFMVAGASSTRNQVADVLPEIGHRLRRLAA